MSVSVSVSVSGSAGRPCEPNGWACRGPLKQRDEASKVSYPPISSAWSEPSACPGRHSRAGPQTPAHAPYQTHPPCQRTSQAAARTLRHGTPTKDSARTPFHKPPPGAQGTPMKSRMAKTVTCQSRTSRTRRTHIENPVRDQPVRDVEGAEGHWPARPSAPSTFVIALRCPVEPLEHVGGRIAGTCDRQA